MLGVAQKMEQDSIGLLATCVGSIREGLRKINVCKDVDKEEILAPVAEERLSPQIEKRHSNNKKHLKGHNSDEKTDFDMHLGSLPTLDTDKRTLEWVLQLPDDCITSESNSSLHNLPMRGTILPTRYTPGQESGVGVEEEYTPNSISFYESARGTHARGTPPKLPQGQPRLDSIFLKLQQSLERDTRRDLIAAGQQHLLSYNLMDVYRHQVAGYPMGTTPEIVPFMSTSLPLKEDPSNIRHTVHCKPARMTNASINEVCSRCHWSNCQAYFTCAKDLMDHIEKTHILIYTTGRLSCQWGNCDMKFSVRYKLLMHVHNAHCREMIAREKRAVLSTRDHSFGRKRLAPVIAGGVPLGKQVEVIGCCVIFDFFTQRKQSHHDQQYLWIKPVSNKSVMLQILRNVYTTRRHKNSKMYY